MKITNNIIYHDRVDVYVNNGKRVTIYFDKDSGKAYFRYKINTISKIKHPGIYIGVDANGTEYFIHNHYQIGTTALCSRQEFDKGKPIYLYDEQCSNDSLTVIERAFENLMKGEKYHFYSNNCQTMVNDSCSNARRSRAVENWTIGVLIICVLAFIFFIASGGNNKKRLVS